MKIKSLLVKELELLLVEGYRIAGQTITAATIFFVSIETDAGLVGYGCAAPAEDVTGESNEICRQALRGPLQDHIDNADLASDPSLLGLSLLDVAPTAPAACAAIDIALWDIAAQDAGQPLVSYLGGAPAAMPTSVTIGICDIAQTVADAKRWLADGFTILKVKTGDNVDTDIERLAVLRETVGHDIVIRVDANQGYDLDDARRFLSATAALRLEMLEQPLDSKNLEDAATLTRESEVPIIADESIVSIADSRRVIDSAAAHGLNIKLMKCGGISAACKIHDAAHSAGLRVMLGCNDESRISIAAALHLAQAMTRVVYVDLDGHMDLANEPATGGFNIRDGRMHLTKRPGLGVSYSA